MYCRGLSRCTPATKPGRSSSESASEVAANIERRFGAAAADMETDLIAVEEACSDETLKPRRALELVRALRRHEETLRNASARHSANLPVVVQT